MQLHQLFEKTIHHDGNLDLVNYFEEMPYEMDHGLAVEYWKEFVRDHLNDDNKARLEAFFHKPINDIEPMDYYGLPARAKRQFAEWTLEMPQNAYDYFMHDDPQGAPAWMLLQPATGKLLPKNTPLVHFSDHAAQIKAQGFTQGIPDINRIALTREHSIFDAPGSAGTRISYGAPGYNFAYMADGTIDLDLRAGGYGASVLLFRSTGMLVHHQGDRENQVVFWGPAATTKTGIVITRENNKWTTDGGNTDMSLNRIVRRLLNPKKA